MNNSTRQKAKRSLVATLLLGNLSDKELREIAVALRHDPNFTAELGTLLDDVAEKLASGGKDAREGNKSPVSSRRPSMLDELMRLVRETHISQKELLDLVAQVAPDIAQAFVGKRLPTHVLLERVLRDNPALTDVIFGEIRKRVVGTGKTDPYLELIEKRLDS
jgi:hypothetical protein